MITFVMICTFDKFVYNLGLATLKIAFIFIIIKKNISFPFLHMGHVSLARIVMNRLLLYWISSIDAFAFSLFHGALSVPLEEFLMKFLLVQVGYLRSSS